MYKISIEKRAIKKLEKISEPYFTKIKSAINGLRNNPKPKGVIKLKGRDAFRIRVADYRIIYEINNHELHILIIEIGHRKNIYH